MKPCSPNSTFSRTAGDFIVAALAEFERNGLCAVYLRNYEKLPNDVGNDVDLLVEPSSVHRWLALFPKVAKTLGWRFLRAVSFSSTSLFFLPPDPDGDVLHIDLNEALEWHCIALVDAARVLSRRHWNGIVFVPSPEDELFLNVATRLVYQGRVREKNREQWRRLRPSCSATDLVETFSSRMSLSIARRMIEAADQNDWEAVLSLRGRIRRSLLCSACFRHPIRLLCRFSKFAVRSVLRLMSPPGLGIVFLGADDPRWITAIQGATQFLARWGNLSETRGRKGNALRLRLFRARNGVTVDCVPKNPSPANGRVPIDLSALSLEGTDEERVRRIQRAVRFAIEAGMELREGRR